MSTLTHSTFLARVYASKSTKEVTAIRLDSPVPDITGEPLTRHAAREGRAFAEGFPRGERSPGSLTTKSGQQHPSQLSHLTQ